MKGSIRIEIGPPLYFVFTLMKPGRDKQRRSWRGALYLG